MMGGDKLLIIRRRLGIAAGVIEDIELHLAMEQTTGSIDIFRPQLIALLERDKPSEEKSPVSDSEIPILIGVVLVAALELPPQADRLITMRTRTLEIPAILRQGAFVCPNT